MQGTSNRFREMLISPEIGTALPRGTAVLFSIELNTRSYEGIPLYEGVTDMDLTERVVRGQTEPLLGTFGHQFGHLSILYSPPPKLGDQTYKKRIPRGS
jgi:hypothetical protein